MKRISTLAFLGAVLCAGAVYGQSSRATLGGRVTDAQGAVIPNADVVVTSENTAVRQTTKTNEQGNWVVQFLLPAKYGFAISVPGFKTAERKGIELQTSDNKVIDTQIEIGTATSEVTVTADAELIDTTAATSGTVCRHYRLPTLSQSLLRVFTFSPDSASPSALRARAASAAAAAGDCATMRPHSRPAAV
jgi:hypothetical protein